MGKKAAPVRAMSKGGIAEALASGCELKKSVCSKALDVLASVATQEVKKTGKFTQQECMETSKFCDTWREFQESAENIWGNKLFRIVGGRKQKKQSKKAYNVLYKKCHWDNVNCRNQGNNCVCNLNIKKYFNNAKKWTSKDIDNWVDASADKVTTFTPSVDETTVTTTGGTNNDVISTTTAADGTDGTTTV